MPRTATGPIRARRTLLASLALSAVVLSACGTAAPDGAGVGGAPGESAGATPAAPSGESGQVAEIISSNAMPATGAAAPAESEGPAVAPPDSLTALPPEPAIDDDPQRLIGMGPASLNAVLGAPELIRREAPASLWQYRAEDCVLDIVLYPDRGGDKVTYLEARENGETKMAARTCLNKLLRARNGGTAG